MSEGATSMGLNHNNNNNNLMVGMGNGNGNTQRKLKCVKYSLMVINSFGILLGVFIVLFGLAYPKEKFPGGFVGQQTAMFAGVFIFFSLVGYCGASQQKNLLMIPYFIIILLLMVYTLFNWAAMAGAGGGCLDGKSLSLCGLLILLLGLAGFLIFRIRRASVISASAQATMAATQESMDKISTTRSTSSFIAIPKFGRKV